MAGLIERDMAQPAKRKSKVTARLTAQDHDALTRMAGDNRISLSYACAVLVRAELRDRWLEKAITTRFES
jgi:hypothetical protein